MLVAVLVLLALAGAVLLCRRDTWLWPVTVILLCGVWVMVNKPLEGPVLVAISRGHGITMSDLLAPAGVAFAAVLLYRRGTEPTRRQPIQDQRTPDQPIQDQRTPDQPIQDQRTSDQPIQD